jgi:hypothetical protein
MINHEHKFIFIHISKTGGTSIEHALNPSVTLDRSNISDITGNTNFVDKHWSAKQYLKEYPKEYREYFKFAFVRNPWDRMLSNYQWLMLLGIINCEFAQWIIKPTYGYNAYNYNRMICNNSGSIIVDYIGKFETLQQDFNKICNKIGIQQQTLSHTNKTNHKHYTEYYNEETKQIIAQKYEKDIEYFGYKFES